MTFQIGEKVVYPNQGVATIESISQRAFGAQAPERYYLLRLAYSNMSVMVPFSHVQQIGLRKVTKNTEVTRMLEFLAAGKPRCSSDWKVRFKENSDRMASGSLLEITEVFKSLVMLQADKPLSFREKKMLERARQMLLAEVAAARGLQEPDAIDLMQRALNKASLRFPEKL
jgi:CarD family transcriptional regulator